ncbi:homeobox protein vent1-like [Thalassophryne amazonica]|uniref:homeobox protein vent1-like n=1 Tax=Thalassophryne amazonica TaxID=390379 RepID=UPI0014722ECB|nr:homeobox protein vent1-like [Thalassophryne amazonica]
MVKYFSVDWLAQSHHSTANTEAHGDGVGAAPNNRRHIPCMVPPRPPAFGEGHLHPKQRKTKAELDVEGPSLPTHPQSCASPNSETGGYSSGYDSEAAGHCAEEAERDDAQRRVRTKFTPEQISKLEQIFNKHKYVDARERVKTAQRLNLTETQVRTWFQNRRMKLKREMQDYFAPQVPPMMYRALPRFQYLSAAGHQSPFYPVPVQHVVLHPNLMTHNSHVY